MMEPNILVKIPDKCYISPDPKRAFPFLFSFMVTYGHIPKKDLIKPERLNGDGLDAIKFPQITISGFEQLLSADRIEEFVSNLKETGSDDWTINKSSSSSDIIMKFIGDELGPDFYFCASTENFISDAKKNEVVILNIAVSRFDGIEDHSYAISTKVDYTPWAKSLTFKSSPVPLGSEVDVFYECEGDAIEKRLSMDGKILDTARSPYTAEINKPSLFTLEVFNQNGLNDRLQALIDVEPPQIISFSADRNYFAQGDKVNLTWNLKSVSSFCIDDLDVFTGSSTEVHPKADQDGKTAVYTLRANGFIDQKPNSITKKVVLTQTSWKKIGAVNGYFTDEVYGNTSYNSRIFVYKEMYYCYAHPVLYKSTDGLVWEQHSQNDEAMDSFICIAAAQDNDTLYAMGRVGKNGNRLYITKYDFIGSTWTYGPAYQACNSDIGSFAFSRNSKFFAQTVQEGIYISGCSEEGKWNVNTSAIPIIKGRKAISGDYCFFKDRYYAVMLGDDNYVYVYDCTESMQEALFKKKVGENSRFVSFVQTFNKLYIMTDCMLTDVKAQESADDFCPPLIKTGNRPWLGLNNDGILFGIFPDKNQWIFKCIERWNTMKKSEETCVTDYNINRESRLLPGGKKHYGKVKLTSDGHFLITGDFQLEIDELENEKNEFSKNKYEFLVKTPDGKDGAQGECGEDAPTACNVTIIIHKLLNDVHIKSLGGNGGNGGNGIKGGDGGNGGDAVASVTGNGTGGCGGNGGDGGDGANGGNGAPAPNVTVIYKQYNNAKVIVLSEDDTPCDDKISYGGKGGNGGKGGEGGKGGKGGLSADGQTLAPGGTCGSCGNNGNNGKDGREGKISINNKLSMSLQLFKEKLKNYQGEYTFDFANDVDSAYLFEEFGGEEKMKKRFPAVYKSYQKAREASLKRLETNAPGEGDVTTCYGRIGKMYPSPIGNGKEDALVQLKVPVGCVFIDATKEVNCNEPAAEWLGVTIQTKVKDKYSPRYLICKSEVIGATNNYEGMVQSSPEKSSDINNKEYHISIDYIGVDPEGKLHKKVINDKQIIGNATYYTIADVKIDDPAPKTDKHKMSNEIMMLYGRMDEQGIYSDADYKGGDYLKNAFDSARGMVHLIIPIKGRIIFDYNVEPLSLLEPTGGEALQRSTATYDYKKQVFTYRSDIREDKALYDKLKGCFQNGVYVKNLQTPVTFDIRISDGDRCPYDWHTDVEGIQNGDPKTIMLDGTFTYRSINQLGVETNDQIRILSLTKEDLDARKRNYYVYEKHTNEIYIPPITIYWGCFGKDVNIMLADKTEEYAGNIKIGDKLLGIDGRVLTVDNVLTGFDTDIYQIETRNKGGIKVSGGHPMMCEGKCVRASQVKTGDLLNLADGSLAEVVSVKIISYNDTVYNFTFEGVENGVYIIANGFYTGDLRMQNTKTKKPERIFTAEEKALINEMMMYNQKILMKNKKY